MTGDPLIARLIASANHVFPLCSASDRFNWQLSHGGLISGRLKAGAAGRIGSTVEGEAKHGRRKSAVGFRELPSGNEEVSVFFCPEPKVLLILLSFKLKVRTGQVYFEGLQTKPQKYLACLNFHNIAMKIPATRGLLTVSSRA